MNGADNSPDEADEPAAAPTQRTPATYPTRGIEQPTSGNGPPPAPDFGVRTPPPTDFARAADDNTGLPVWGPPVGPPQRTSRPWVTAAIIGAIGAVLVVVLGLVVMGVGSILTLASNPGETAPSFGTDESGQEDPGTTDPGTSAEADQASLQAMIDEYKVARDNGSLWATIPDTEFNRTALSAFLYLLTDMKVAALWGADTSEYLAEADELEQKLLNQEPLGSDVTIKLSDRTFTYDGDTGAGGYTNN